MQNAHELSHPIWMVTQPAQGTSRRTGSADGNVSWSSATAASRISMIDRPSTLDCSMQQRGGPVHVVGAEHDVDVAGPLQDGVPVLLGQAAADDDLHPGLLVLDRLQVPEGAVELVVGVLPDAAGVEHDDVGVVDPVGRHEAIGLSRPAIRSESCSFIWHPKVRTKKRRRLGHARQARARRPLRPQSEAQSGPVRAVSRG